MLMVKNNDLVELDMKFGDHEFLIFTLDHTIK